MFLQPANHNTAASHVTGQKGEAKGSRGLQGGGVLELLQELEMILPSDQRVLLVNQNEPLLDKPLFLHLVATCTGEPRGVTCLGRSHPDKEA